MSYDTGITGLLLGLSLIAVGICLLYSYAQTITMVDDSPAPPAFIFQIFDGFKLAAKICIVLGSVLAAICLLLTPGLHVAEQRNDIPLSLYYIAALGLLLIILSYNVLHHRVRGILQTFGQENPLTDRIARVHANFTEYVPTGLVLLVSIEWAGAPPLLVHTAGCIFTLGRYLHAWGYTATDGPHPGRMVGIQMTLLALCLMVFSAVYYLFFV